jgi:hypothetical protein
VVSFRPSPTRPVWPGHLPPQPGSLGLSIIFRSQQPSQPCSRTVCQAVNRHLCSGSQRGLLLYSVSLAVGIEALDLEILAVSADWALPTALCLSVPAWLARVIDSVLPSSSAGLALSSVRRPFQPWYCDFRRLTGPRLTASRAGRLGDSETGCCGRRPGGKKGEVRLQREPMGGFN